MAPTYTFTAELWLAQAEAAWVFLTVPPEISDDIEERAPTKAGFGSVPVSVTIGATTWRTSVFPDAKRGAYILPVKRPVRTAESIAVGDEVAITLRLVDPAGS
jgi:hypothetical protein